MRSESTKKHSHFQGSPCWGKIETAHIEITPTKKKNGEKIGKKDGVKKRNAWGGNSGEVVWEMASTGRAFLFHRVGRSAGKNSG